MSVVFNPEQKAKLTQLINEGIQVLSEVEDLNAKPAVLKKAIRIAQKSSFTDTNNDHETLTTVLETVGRTL